MTTTVADSGQVILGDRVVHRLGYSGMKLTGPRVLGPPADREAALAVLRRAVELGVDHIDTSGLYGPHVVNDLIREALHPYPEDLVIVTRVGARRTPEGAWQEALTPAELRRSVEEDLEHLGLDALHVATLRMPGLSEPAERSLAEPFEALARLQQQGLVHRLGVTHTTSRQVAEARAIAPLACVQNHYNLIHRTDDRLVEDLARDGIAYTALEGVSYTSFFPVGEMTPPQSAVLETVAGRVGASPVQVAVAWLLARAPNVLVIPGATSVAQLEELFAAGEVELGPADIEDLDRIAGMGGPAPPPGGGPAWGGRRG
ncbi:aryl-alcohol dehydrogenase-like predicted oxidoreductase [Geodermatophilus bullaregiensis]|uniref:oxidoreductase n=1 Tax=Geodermatophilus bullaregiensis TaxID=1564160 RepID=UPI001958616E|nr:oxidoreductase [Geodermatophilus bullaregiensis]MBM7806440.1 aryl-alcohol dehydrogenase-like predicted oxidoreductase [Geodermatophilus bullaregiensis]